MTYVPDIGERFTVTRTWAYRRWQWAPFPWYRRRVIAETSSYRVDGWMCRRRPRLGPFDERTTLTREIIDEMVADGRMDAPRALGPDNVPLEFCRREEAEYVSGRGVAGTIQRVADVTVTGRVSWPEELIQNGRDHANRMAGEPLT